MNALRDMGVERLSKKKNWYSGFDEPNEFEVTVQPMACKLYKIFLFGAIADAAQFTGAIEVFNRAGPEDAVEIYLSTPGGSMDAADTFIDAMHSCEAKVHVLASGGVHSAGTLILLNAPSFSLSKNFNALVHNGSCGAGGDLNKFVAWSRHNEEYMQRVFRETYTGFLNPEELEQMLQGKDFWMDGDEFCRRYESRNEHFKADAALALDAEPQNKKAKPRKTH